MKFICLRCHYTTNTKRCIVDHLQRKKPCLPLYSEESPSDVLDTILRRPTKAFPCDKCDKSFTQLSNLCRHKKQCHTQDETGDKVFYREIRNKESAATPVGESATLTHMHSFGNEDISSLENDSVFLQKCLQNILSTGISNLVEKIFFNDNLPQNKNVKLKREHKPGVMLVYEKSQTDIAPCWKERDLDEIIATMVIKAADILAKYNHKMATRGGVLIDDGKDAEMFDLHMDQLTKVKNMARGKQRGVMGNMKNKIIRVCRNCQAK